MRDTLASFRELTGIGPATAARLRGTGVYAWAAFADVLRALINVRGIIADMLKALSMLTTHLASDPGATTAPGPPNPEHGETFILRMSVDVAGRPTRSIVTHMRSQTDRLFSGWSPREVIEFVEEQTGLVATGAPGPRQDTDEPAPGRASNDHVVAIDAGTALGGRPQTIALIVSTAGLADVGTFEYRATLGGRPYGAMPGEASWVTLGQHAGHGDPREHLPLRFEQVDLAPGVHRLRLEMALTLQKPRHAAPVLQLA